MANQEREFSPITRRRFLTLMAVVGAVMAGCSPREETAATHDPNSSHEATPTTVQSTATQETILPEATSTELSPTPEPSPTLDNRVTVTPATGEEFRFDPSVLEQLPLVPDEVDQAMRNVTYDGIKPPMEPINGVIVRIGLNPVMSRYGAHETYDYDVAYSSQDRWRVITIHGFPPAAYTVDAITPGGERIPGAFQTLDINPGSLEAIKDGVITIPGLKPVYPGSPVTVYLSTGSESRLNWFEKTHDLSKALDWPFEQSMGTIFYQDSAS